jgi:uncharacterized protein YeeX (DUF496 family)
MWEDFMKRHLSPQLAKDKRTGPDGKEVDVWTTQEIDAIIQAMRNLYEETLTDFESVNNPSRMLLTPSAGPINNALKGALEHVDPPISIRAFRDDFVMSNEFGFGKFKEELKKTDAFEAAMQELSWVYDAPRLIEWYDALKTPEAKAIAIRNTNGYLRHTKWLIPNAKAKDLGGKTPFAVLNIGADHVQGLLEKVRNDVMDEVFSIFDNMAEMSDELNSFFANGLKQQAKAIKGAEAGEEAAQTAKKVAGVDTPASNI